MTKAPFIRGASLALAALTWAIAVVVAVIEPRATAAAAPPASPQAAAPPVAGARPSDAVWWLAPNDSRQFVGSRACERCHADAYAEWAKALHLHMTKAVADTRIQGDFVSNPSFEQHGRRYSMETRDGRYFISVAHGARPAETFEVHYTLGARRVQGYLSRLADGGIYVLPVFWHAEQRRWFDWKEITPVPDTDEDLRQIWNVTCYNCHATNLNKGFDVEKKTYDSTWSEMGVGCEACHGPGQAHVAIAESWERQPATRPAIDLRRSNRMLSRSLKIFAARSADRRQVFDTCAYCHGNKNNLFDGFVPGARYEDYALPFLVSQPVPADDPQGDFWPDGRPSRFNRPQALMQTGCFLEGQATCVSCHAPHGSPHVPSLKVAVDKTDLLCLQCHGADADTGGGRPSRRRFELDALAEHTFHPADSEGSRCVNCHMADVNWRLLMRRRDHTFKPPVPELTARLGVPNACNECHDNRTPEWAVAQMDRWYGDTDRRRRARELARATVFYEAAEGQASALPALSALLVDRRVDPVTRASAAEFIGRLVLRLVGGLPGGRVSQSQTSFETRAGASPAPDMMPMAATASAGAITPALVNALMGAAADPEATVRAHATRALGFAGQSRTVPALTARLVDSARAVRVAAAEALLHFGITQLDGQVGVALRRAQDEYAASLSTFGDMPGDHLALGWLETQRGRHGEAKAALSRAMALDPAQVQPRVVLGVVAAREGRYADAIAEWEQVKAVAPDWPNIDRLIEEARKRLKEGR